MRLTAKQREALDEATTCGGLVRRVDGWVAADNAKVFGHHSFQTVHSLVQRKLLALGPDRKTAVPVTRLTPLLGRTGPRPSY